MGEYLSRKYMIFDVSEIDKINFNEVYETSIETMRVSLNGLKTFVKWGGDEPSCVSNLNTKMGPYNYDEILQILSTEEWTDPNPKV
jgi:hypothetical protein